VSSSLELLLVRFFFLEDFLTVLFLTDIAFFGVVLAGAFELSESESDEEEPESELNRSKYSNNRLIPLSDVPFDSLQTVSMSKINPNDLIWS
jgi:hypothetical protein